MGAKFVATASFNKQNLDLLEQEDKTIKFSADVSAWVVSAKGSYKSSDSTSTQKTSSSEVYEEDQYTVGTTLPEGITIRDKLNKWASNDEKIMAFPMPIGDMQLIPLAEAIL